MIKFVLSLLLLYAFIHSNVYMDMSLQHMWSLSMPTCTALTGLISIILFLLGLSAGMLFDLCVLHCHMCIKTSHCRVWGHFFSDYICCSDWSNIGYHVSTTLQYYQMCCLFYLSYPVLYQVSTVQ